MLCVEDPFFLCFMDILCFAFSSKGTRLKRADSQLLYFAFFFLVVVCVCSSGRVCVLNITCRLLSPVVHTGAEPRQAHTNATKREKKFYDNGWRCVRT